MKIEELRELLRLILVGKRSNHAITAIMGKSWHTSNLYRLRVNERGITWKDIRGWDDKQLREKLSVEQPQSLQKDQPDWPYIHQCMQQKHQTLIQLWEEYRSTHLERAYSYSQFTHHYRRYIKCIDIYMRQTHLPGDVCFVDFAGKRIQWTDSETGESHWAEIFVGVLGYSQLNFAMAIPSQKQEDWIEAHKAMFDYFQGVSQSVVPDNLKSAVITPGKEPVINRSYQELSEHYGFIIEPARVRKPQDKSLAEIGVLLVTRWITVVLRRRQFFSVDEINQAIAPLLEMLNRRDFKRYEGSRLTRFNECEKQALQPLPHKSFIYGSWLANQTVNRDYHVYVEGHAYSVPYDYVGQRVDVRLTKDSVAFYADRKLIATHLRSNDKEGATTLEAHRPLNHRLYSEQNKCHFINWAEPIGEYAKALVHAQFEDKSDFSVVGSKACSHLSTLAKQYGNERFEKACQCACEIRSMTVSSVRSILQCRLDESRGEANTTAQLPLHANVRGNAYYTQTEMKL